MRHIIGTDRQSVIQADLQAASCSDRPTGVGSRQWWLMGCLHDPANVQQTSSKCIQNTRANAGRSLDRV